mmetsp:Transcript_66612/g.206551  ORF Transcript_66612/g.206551 Transcript_66612/m.206551 type:complete len:230 (-) Transcript_66612:1336-2025(-)
MAAGPQGRALQAPGPGGPWCEPAAAAAWVAAARGGGDVSLRGGEAADRSCSAIGGGEACAGCCEAAAERGGDGESRMAAGVPSCPARGAESCPAEIEREDAGCREVWPLPPAAMCRCPACTAPLPPETAPALNMPLPSCSSGWGAIPGRRAVRPTLPWREPPRLGGSDLSLRPSRGTRLNCEPTITLAGTGLANEPPSGTAHGHDAATIPALAASSPNGVAVALAGVPE